MMEKIKFLLLLSAIIGAVQCFCDNDAAYLTQYIQSGNLALGKQKATVYSPELLLKGITSYSGYLTVDAACNSNIFFWFFPAQKNSASAPVVLWLQGGPGASSVYGMLMENGPVLVNTKNRLDAREYTWTKDYNVLYIDNPVGAGFSYTDNPACYAKSKDDIEANLLEALRRFFQLFKDLRGNEFYITGESYAGKYVPILGHAIYKNKDNEDPSYRINLKGVAIGNGVSDPVNQINWGDYLYWLGYISLQDRALFNQYQGAAINFINNKQFANGLPYTFGLINTKLCLFNNITGFESDYNSLRFDGYNPTIDRVSAYLTDPNGIKKCLNVGARNFQAFSETNPVLQNLANDILDSVAPYVAELANNYRVIIYTGQLDLLINVAGTENYLTKLNFNGVEDLKNAKRGKWYVDNEIAGWFVRGENVDYVIVHGAGHMVPFDQPKHGYDLIRRLTTNTRF